MKPWRSEEDCRNNRSRCRRKWTNTCRGMRWALIQMREWTMWWTWTRGSLMTNSWERALSVTVCQTCLVEGLNLFKILQINMRMRRKTQWRPFLSLEQLNLLLNPICLCSYRNRFFRIQTRLIQTKIVDSENWLRAHPNWQGFQYLTKTSTKQTGYFKRRARGMTHLEKMKKWKKPKPNR